MAPRSKRRRPASCPCGSRRLLDRCCGRLHGGVLPETPEQLMRSRYAAYALGLTDYIVETTDPDGPVWHEDTDAWRAEIDAFSAGARFTGLTVAEHGADGDEGWVAFEARFVGEAGPQSIRERSRFVRRDGRWLYHGPS